MDKRYAPTLLVTTTLAVLAGALPQSASAVTICAGDASADCFLTYPGTSAGLKTALDSAQSSPGADVVRVGPGSFTGEFGHVSNDPVDIVGAGTGATHITSPDAKPALYVSSPGTPATVTDLEVSPGPGTAAGIARGLVLDGAVARRVRVTNPLDSATQVATGVVLGTGAEFRDGVVDVGGAKGVVGSQSGDHVVTDSVIKGRVGVGVEGGTAKLSRLRIEATAVGVESAVATTEVRNSLILLSGIPQFDVALEQLAAGTLTADGVTLVGGPQANYGAAAVNTNPGTATLNMTNSVVHGFAKSLLRYANVPNFANLNVDYSRFAPPAPADVGAAQGPGTYTEGTGNVSADPAFVNPAFGAADADYHLRPGSPLIDAGAPGPVLDKDLDSHIRSSDGDGSGGARRDMGAYEYRPAPPSPPAPSTGPSPAPPATPATVPAPNAPAARRDTVAPALTRVKLARGKLRFRLSERATVTVLVQRKRGRKGYRRIGVRRIRGHRGTNVVRFKSVAGRTVASGRYRLRLTAVDGAFNRSRARQLSVAVRR